VEQIAMHEMKGFLACNRNVGIILAHSMVWKNVYHALLSPLAALLPPQKKKKTSLMKYLPDKHHHHWGTKVWMLCNSVSNYCLGFFTQGGARSQEDEDNIQRKIACSTPL
jgi:hypothetical protein